MTVRGIQHQHVDLRLDQRRSAIQHVGGGTDGGGAQQTSARVTGGIRVFHGLFDILDGDEAAQHTRVVDERQLLDAVAGEDLLRLLEGRADGADDEVILGHHVADAAGIVGDETHIAVGENADELTVHADRHAGDLELTHQRVRVRDGVVGGQREGIDDNAVLRTLDHIHLIGLRLDGHILVDNTDAALTRDGDRHLRLGDRVHSGGHQRGVERHALRQLGAHADVRRQHIGCRRNEQHVVEGQTFF